MINIIYQIIFYLQTELYNIKENIYKYIFIKTLFKRLLFLYSIFIYIY